tara:strand:- start:69 stop:320 length:252 start_codon:yes stop_codon:yes gene_type:complete
MPNYKPNERERRNLSARHLDLDGASVKFMIATLDEMIGDLEGQTEMTVCECCNREHYSDLAAHRTRESLGAARNRLKKVLESL